MFTAFSCTRENLNKVIVVKDCTGSYLEVNGKDFGVCNIERLERYADRDAIHAKFILLNECTAAAVRVPVCEIYHSHEGRIQIIKPVNIF